jgi:hypothetical protein
MIDAGLEASVKPSAGKTIAETPVTFNMHFPVAAALASMISSWQNGVSFVGREESEGS